MYTHLEPFDQVHRYWLARATEIPHGHIGVQLAKTGKSNCSARLADVLLSQEELKPPSLKLNNTEHM